MHSYSLGSTDFNLAGIADAEKNEKKNLKLCLFLSESNSTLHNEGDANKEYPEYVGHFLLEFLIKR